MRGREREQDSMFSYVSLEDRVPQDHPLRGIRPIVDAALQRLSPNFDALYDRSSGRESIPPEQLIRALLLQVLYTIRSERQLVEQLDYNLLYRWFVGLGIDDRVWNHSSFSKNRDRLLSADIAARFFEEVVDEAKKRNLISTEHFSVDGTLIKAWASQKSFQADPEKLQNDDDNDPPASLPHVPKHRRKFLSKDDRRRNPDVNFRGEKRSNATHTSVTDPEARLARKSNGTEAQLSYTGHVVTENRHGLIVVAAVSEATGTAERDLAPEMVSGIRHRRQWITVGADKGYDAEGCVNGLRAAGATPHVASKDRYSAIDGRTTSWDGYAVSQRKRKLVEQCFGWMKTVGPMRQTKYRGLGLVDWSFMLSAAAFNLVRIRNLTAAA